VMKALRVVKLCYLGRTTEVGNDLGVTVPFEKVPANYVPAAAVIRRGQALSGFIGRKACVGGLPSLRSKPEAQPRFVLKTGRLEFGRGKWNF
jgi:hypothetical protein